MLEDLKELRSILDRYIAKYEKQDEYMGYKFENGDKFIKTELSKKEDGGMEECTLGNDYY